MRLYLAILGIHGDSDESREHRRTLWINASPAEREICRGQLDALAVSLFGMAARAGLLARRVEQILRDEPLILSTSDQQIVNEQMIMDSNEIRERSKRMRSRVLSGIMSDPTLSPTNRSHTGMAAPSNAEGNMSLLEAISSVSQIDDINSMLAQLDLDMAAEFSLLDKEVSNHLADTSSGVSGGTLEKDARKSISKYGHFDEISLPE